MNRLPNHCQELAFSDRKCSKISGRLPLSFSLSLSVSSRFSLEDQRLPYTFRFGKSAHFRSFISVYQSLSRPPSRCSSISSDSSAHVALLVRILDQIIASQHPVGLLVLIGLLIGASVSLNLSLALCFFRFHFFPFFTATRLLLPISSFVTFPVVIRPIKFCDIDFPRRFPSSSWLN